MDKETMLAQEATVTLTVDEWVKICFALGFTFTHAEKELEGMNVMEVADKIGIEVEKVTQEGEFRA